MMASVKDLMVGLAIAEDMFGPEHQLGGAEHDIVYLFPPGTELTEADERALKAAGWHYSEDDGWCHFV